MPKSNEAAVIILRPEIHSLFLSAGGALQFCEVYCIVIHWTVKFNQFIYRVLLDYSRVQWLIFFVISTARRQYHADDISSVSFTKWALNIYDSVWDTE